MGFNSAFKGLKNPKHGVSPDAECGRRTDERGKAKRGVFAT